MTGTVYPTQQTTFESWKQLKTKELPPVACEVVIPSEGRFAIVLSDERALPILWVCPHCDEPWAWLKCPGRRDYFCRYVPCAKCNRAYSRHVWPGSILYMPAGQTTIYDEFLFSALTPELTAREFDIHIRQFENEQRSAIPPPRN